MPFVQPASPAATRINEALFLELLEMPAPHNAGKSFALGEGILPPDGTASLEFSVLRNDGRVLSLQVDAEGCGAYCEEYQRFFNFDARNGRALAIDDLLTGAGLAEAGKRLSDERRRQYRGQIRQLKRELAAARKSRKTKQDDLSDLEDRLALNESCLAGLGAPPGAGALRESIRDTRFAVLDSGLRFTVERCSSHAMRALDDVGDVVMTLDAAALDKLLLPYGRSLLIGGEEIPAPVSWPDQILTGRIGGAAVTVRLGRPYSDGSLNGTYYYDKFRKPIGLRGKKNGKRIELTENLPEGEKGEPGRLELSEDANGLSGRWLRGDKSLPARFGW